MGNQGSRECDMDIPNLEDMDYEQLGYCADVYGQLSRYCALRRFAMDMRAGGHEDTARMVDRKADSVYRDVHAYLG